MYDTICSRSFYSAKLKVSLSSNSLNFYNSSLFNADEQITFNTVQYIIHH